MSLIPNTPYEVLRFSNPLLKPVVPVLLWAVERLGLWKTPRQGSASDITQMGVLDNLYWVYKSKNLVRLPEPELDELHPDCTSMQTSVTSVALNITRVRFSRAIRRGTARRIA